MSLSRYTSIALATLFIICACEKIEPLEEGDDKGKSEQETPGDPTPTITDDTVTVSKSSEFPKAWTLWNKHLVVDVEIKEDDPNCANLLLLAREEFDNVYSYLHETKSGDAWKRTNSYSEEGITGWEIPDKGTAEFLVEECNDNTHLPAVNKLLQNAMPISPYKQNGQGNVRYLCRPNHGEGDPEATLTFAFVEGSAISKAGKTTAYRLRPVKYLTITKGKK